MRQRLQRLTGDLAGGSLRKVFYRSPRYAACPACKGTLDRHQPDPARPERMLGVCCDCGSWYLLDDVLCVLYPLPDVWGGSDSEN